MSKRTKISLVLVTPLIVMILVLGFLHFQKRGRRLEALGYLAGIQEAERSYKEVWGYHIPDAESMPGLFRANFNGHVLMAKPDDLTETARALLDVYDMPFVSRYGYQILIQTPDGELIKMDQDSQPRVMDFKVQAAE